MKKERRHHSAEQKVTILRRHLLEKTAVSDLCQEVGLQPTVFYRWQKEFFENGASAESMTEADIEIILQAAKEKYPEARPRIISNNGPQFIAKDFKEFIRISGMTHVRTSLCAIVRFSRSSIAGNA